jgi:hypothetical protein
MTDWSFLEPGRGPLYQQVKMTDLSAEEREELYVHPEVWRADVALSPDMSWQVALKNPLYGVWLVAGMVDGIDKKVRALALKELLKLHGAINRTGSWTISKSQLRHMHQVVPGFPRVVNESLIGGAAMDIAHSLSSLPAIEASATVLGWIRALWPPAVPSPPNPWASALPGAWLRRELVVPAGAHLRESDGWRVGPADLMAASQIVRAFHYTKSASNTGVAIDGLYEPGGALVGVAWWNVPVRPAAEGAAAALGPAVEAANARAVAAGRKPPFTKPLRQVDPKEVLSLLRLVVAPGMPTNAASFLLGRSMAGIDRRRYPLFLTFADEGQGHEGKIYLATNWLPAGRNKPKMGQSWRRAGTDEVRGTKRGKVTLTHAEMRAQGFEPVPPTTKIRFLHPDLETLRIRKEKKP